MTTIPPIGTTAAQLVQAFDPAGRGAGGRTLAALPSAGQVVDPALLRSLTQAMGARDVHAAIDGVRVLLVEDGQAGPADAVYDANAGAVLVTRSVLDTLHRAADSLKRFRAARAAGQVTPEMLAAVRGDRRAAATSLALLAHEAYHARQDTSGAIDRAMGEVATIADPQRALARYVELVEVPAQREQELTQLAMRQPPRDGRWLTIDAAGRPLPDAEAARNMLALHGDTYAQSLGEALPGYRFPGYRFPGYRFPGYRFPGHAGE